MNIDNTPLFIALGVNRVTGRLSVRAYQRRDVLDSFQEYCSSCVSASWAERESILNGIHEGFPLVRLSVSQKLEAEKQYRDLVAIYDALDEVKACVRGKEGN